MNLKKQCEFRYLFSQSKCYFARYKDPKKKDNRECDFLYKYDYYKNCLVVICNMLHTNLKPFVNSKAPNDVGVYEKQQSILLLFCNIDVKC